MERMILENVQKRDGRIQPFDKSKSMSLLTPNMTETVRPVLVHSSEGKPKSNA